MRDERFRDVRSRLLFTRKLSRKNRSDLVISCLSRARWLFAIYLLLRLSKVRLCCLRILPLPKFIGRLLCFLGFHDFRIVQESFSFGGGIVEKVECKRCGLIATRQAKN